MPSQKLHDSWQFENIPETQDVDYHSAWRSYALRRNLALTLLSSWLPASFGLFYWSRHYAHRPLTALGIIGIWLGSAVAAVWWSGEFRCPRCRRRYGALGHRKGDTNFTRGLFDEVCANCKLARFEQVG
jgi:hypothetical protein